MIVSQPTLESLRRWDPEQIGPYTLLGRLGAGAMGQVYLGRSTAGRLVAVKTIKIELAEEPGFRARFAREVAAARRVSGVFTAAVVAADAEADVPWLATAYVPAPSLSKLVKATGPLPVPTVRWLAAGCAEALESIHLAGLVHRDLKPSNVLVAPDGPRVIDFGVARAAERVALTVTRGAVGTPGYMAPEQARDSQHASLASDVYSLGATLLYAATGHAPYHGDTVMDVLVKLATEPPDLTGLPPELAGLINACLAHSPRDRPTSAKLLAGLGSFVEGSTAAADGHTYLPDSAMALIAGYQRSPQPARGPSDTANDDPTSDEPTSASHTALPPPGRGRATQRQQRRREPSAGDARNQPPHGPHLPQRPQARIALIASAAVSRPPCWPSAGHTWGPRSTRRWSPATGSQPHARPPCPRTSAETLPTGTSTTPKLVLNQPSGTVTGFVIHGMGFVPNTRVVLSLGGPDDTAAGHPEVDPVGTFNYVFDQDHLFFRGGCRSGATRSWPPGPVAAGTRVPGRGAPPPGRRRPGRRRPGRRPPAAADRPAAAGPGARARRLASALAALRPAGSTTGPPGASTRPDRSAVPGRPG